MFNQIVLPISYIKMDGPSYQCCP